jgi:hypothetical protein
VNKNRYQAILHLLIIYDFHDPLGLLPVGSIASEMGEILHLQLESSGLGG